MNLIQLIKNNPDKPWNWCGLSMNPNVTTEYVTNNPDKPWDWYWLSRNPNITMEDVTNNPDKPWNWTSLSYNRMSKHPYIIKKKKRIANLNRKFRGVVSFLIITNRYKEEFYQPGNKGYANAMSEFKNLKG